jgi:hypothetical protein
MTAMLRASIGCGHGPQEATAAAGHQSAPDCVGRRQRGAPPLPESARPAARQSARDAIASAAKPDRVMLIFRN